MNPYGCGSFTAKALTWIAVTVLATLSLEIAAVFGAAAGIGLFLGLTIGGLVLFGWFGAQRVHAKQTAHECA
jgi:hypothetical protein